MADFYPLVMSALSKLERTDEEERQALYERARTTLAERLRNIDPPLPEQRIMQERLAFEEAVRRAEADWARGLVERELLSKLAEAIEQQDLIPEPPQRPQESWMQLSEGLRQSRSGARFAHAQDGTFALAATGTQADAAMTGDALVRSIRSELEDKARDLALRVSRLSQSVRPDGLIEALGLFAKRMGRPGADVAADIGTLWALCVALSGYAENWETPAYDEEDQEPPEEEAARALRDLVAASGPWIHNFPTGRLFDEQTQTLGSAPEEIVSAAIAFLRGAEAAGLLDPEAVTILGAMLEGSDSLWLVERAGHWIIGSACNLAIALLLVLGRIVREYGGGGSNARQSEVAREIEGIVLDHEPDLLQMFSQLPDAIRGDLRAIVAAIHASAKDDV